MASTSFPLFMYLPFELRARVWELTAKPRIVHVEVCVRETTQTDYEADGNRVLERNVCSLTPIPAIVQVCREARQLGVYQQLFSELEDVRDGGERRYVWFNPELDVVDAGWNPLDTFIPAAASIQRLIFMRDSVDIEDVICLGQYVNLKELCIEIWGSLWLNFYELFKRFPLHCGMENIVIVDRSLNLVPLRMADVSDYERAETAWLISAIETTLRTRGIQWGL